MRGTPSFSNVHLSGITAKVTIMIVASMIGHSIGIGRRTVGKGVTAPALTGSIGAGASHAGEGIDTAHPQELN